MAADNLQILLTLADKMTPELKKAMDKVERQLKDFEKSVGKVKFNMMADKELNSALSRFNVYKGKIVSSMKDLHSKLRLDDPITISDITHTATQSLPFFALTKAVNVAKDFETAMADITKTGHVARKDVAMTQQAIIKLAKEIGKSPVYVAQAYQSAIQSGLHHEDVMKQLKIVEKAAIAFDLPVQETTRQLNFIRQNFKLGMEQVADFGDVISDLHHQLGSALTGDILNITSELSGLATQSGITKETIASMAGVMLNSGADASRTQNALKTLITHTGLLDTFFANKKLRMGWLKDAGVDVDKFAKLMKSNPNQGMIEILRILRDSPKAKSGLLGLVGKDYFDVIATLSQNLEKFDFVQKRILTGKHIGSMAFAFDEKMKTMQKQTDILNTAIQNLGITIGNIFLPAATQIITSIAKMIDSSRKFVDNNKDFIKSIGTLATALATLKVGTLALRLIWQAFFLKEIFAMGKNVMGFIKLIKELNKAEAISTGLAIAKATIKNPLKAAASAAALAGIGYAGYKGFQKLFPTENKDAIEEFKNMIPSIDTSNVEKSKNLYTPIPQSWNGKLDVDIRTDKGTINREFDLSTKNQYISVDQYRY